MAFITGTLQSGTYTITNVSSGNYATVKDANKGSNLYATNDSNSDDVKWTIAKLSNNTYTLLSYVWATYARVGAAPNNGDPVTTKSDDPFQWSIRETATRGVYLIYPPAEDSLYWGFVNSNQNTNVKLTTNGDTKAQWQFTRVAA
jgi:hypothetical protein